ncbi:MAG: hypothetical protein ACRDNF_06645 [Streptosporangiaceae bacterium]
MSDIENAMRHLRDVITGRTDGLCGRLNQDKQNVGMILVYGSRAALMPVPMSGG